jgi:hypothetical protein
MEWIFIQFLWTSPNFKAGTPMSKALYCIKPRRCSNHLNPPIGVSKRAYTPSDDSTTTRYQACTGQQRGEGNCHVARESVSKLTGPMLTHDLAFLKALTGHEWIGDSIWDPEHLVVHLQPVSWACEFGLLAWQKRRDRGSRTRPIRTSLDHWTLVKSLSIKQLAIVHSRPTTESTFFHHISGRLVSMAGLWLMLLQPRPCLSTRQRPFQPTPNFSRKPRNSSRTRPMVLLTYEYNEGSGRMELIGLILARGQLQYPKNTGLL